MLMGELLRDELKKNGWEIVNHTPLPVVCFRDPFSAKGKTEEFLTAIANSAVASGKVWISPARLDARTPVIRACITNYRTVGSDIEFLVSLLCELRDKMSVAAKNAV